MIRRPPRSTRTDTLFPYTTLFRSSCRDLGPSVRRLAAFLPHPHHPGGGRRNPLSVTPRRHHRTAQCHALARRHAADRRLIFRTAATHAFRSDERRVGNACFSTSRSWRSPYHLKKKTQ